MRLKRLVIVWATVVLGLATVEGAFISRLGSGGVSESVFGGDVFIGGLNSGGGPAGFSGEFEVLPDYRYVFVWTPTDNGGGLLFNVTDGVFVQNFVIGNTGEVIESDIAPGVYSYEILASGGRAGGFAWTLQPKFVPEWDGHVVGGLFAMAFVFVGIMWDSHNLKKKDQERKRRERRELEAKVMELEAGMGKAR